ncbi:hypothetical protein LINPERHAP1_LOCUS35013 [Linum perenne]
MDFRPDELPVLLCDRSPSSSNFGSSNFFVVDRCEIPFCSVYLTLAVLQFSEDFYRYHDLQLRKIYGMVCYITLNLLFFCLPGP